MGCGRGLPPPRSGLPPDWEGAFVVRVGGKSRKTLICPRLSQNGSEARSQARGAAIMALSAFDVTNSSTCKSTVILMDGFCYDDDVGLTPRSDDKATQPNHPTIELDLII